MNIIFLILHNVYLVNFKFHINNLIVFEAVFFRATHSVIATPVYSFPCEAHYVIAKHRVAVLWQSPGRDTWLPTAVICLRRDIAFAAICLRRDICPAGKLWIYLNFG